MRADASFAVPVKLWALLCVFAGVTIGGNVLLTCILTGGAFLYLVLQRSFRLAASYGCFYLLLALLLYGIRFHGLRMPVFSEFYVLMFWNLSPIFLVSWDLITTPPGMLSAFLSRLRMPTPFILGLLVVFRFFPTMRAELKGVGMSMKNRGLTAAGQLLAHPVQSMEYVLVPFLLRVLQLADQLSVSAVARGAERPGVRGAGLYRSSRMCDSHGFLFGFGKEHGMIELTRASFQYENSDRGVQDISLSVKGGECVVLTGLSGCGKTTVTRLVNGLAPSYYPGAFSGSVRIDGKDISRLSTWEIGRLVGSVFQDPKSQFFSSELAGEVAFPCENYGLSAREIRERTDAAIAALKLSHLKDRAVDILSSGEKQRAAIASVYAMKPKAFVCDEPTANLDAAGTRQLAQTLRQLKEQGITLLIAEHRIDWLMGIADRFLYLRDGRIAAEYTPEDLRLLPEADILGMGLRSPHEGKSLPAPSVLDESPAVLKTAGLSKRIRKEVIFEDISLSVPKGSVTAITGQNGAGKSTLAQILCGLARQTRGHILIDGKKARAAVRRREIYYCGNDTSTQFFTASVAEELLLNTGLTEESKSHARNLLKEFGLYEYRDAHPSALSGGQKQRLAIACAIFSGRRILILDEPTSGLDGQNMRLIAEKLKSEARRGRTILVITHDKELIESCCDNIVEIAAYPNSVSHGYFPSSSA